MKLSAKSRYALASLVKMALVHESQPTITVLEIADELEISKIYLERIFSELRRGEVVGSIKGSQGGYYLTRAPKEISLYDILHAVEPALFSENDATVDKTSQNIERALVEMVYTPMKEGFAKVLTAISLADITLEAQGEEGNYMYYL
ncbi:MAG TPA: Rrf2 family transcriptional regulator [Candidatus Ignatzschineria merdigallinarum]|uniref:Rrf2 family transcriptional regulator n=1 Tax=Candidatus Ignatzschineria merdigallinarum TaxID=2838621 RepID=A0A9D1Q5X6_9GAMM|nr:Rrf2 family transcriptional regulator [Candidatus Ignatzschineria merdigallinarum]